jgi:hypothetical protein
MDLHVSRDSHFMHVAKHFELGNTLTDWTHSRVILGLLQQPTVRDAWRAVVTRLGFWDFPGRTSQLRFSWDPKSTGRVGGIAECNRLGQLQDFLEHFCGSVRDAEFLARLALDSADSKWIGLSEDPVRSEERMEIKGDDNDGLPVVLEDVNVTTPLPQPPSISISISETNPALLENDARGIGTFKETIAPSISNPPMCITERQCDAPEFTPEAQTTSGKAAAQSTPIQALTDTMPDARQDKGLTIHLLKRSSLPTAAFDSSRQYNQDIPPSDRTDHLDSPRAGRGDQRLNTDAILRTDSLDLICQSETHCHSDKADDSSDSQSQFNEDIWDVELREDELIHRTGEALNESILNSSLEDMVDLVMEEFWAIWNQEWDLPILEHVNNSASLREYTNQVRSVDNGTNSPTFSSTVTRKRARNEDEYPNEDDDDKVRRPSGPPASKIPLPSGKKLACPFRKHDPVMYSLSAHIVCAASGWELVHRLK